MLQRLPTLRKTRSCNPAPSPAAHYANSEGTRKSFHYSSKIKKPPAQKQELRNPSASEKKKTSPSPSREALDNALRMIGLKWGFPTLALSKDGICRFQSSSLVVTLEVGEHCHRPPPHHQVTKTTRSGRKAKAVTWLSFHSSLLKVNTIGNNSEAIAVLARAMEWNFLPPPLPGCRLGVHPFNHSSSPSSDGAHLSVALCQSQALDAMLLTPEGLLQNIVDFVHLAKKLKIYLRRPINEDPQKDLGSRPSKTSQRPPLIDSPSIPRSRTSSKGPPPEPISPPDLSSLRTARLRSLRRKGSLLRPTSSSSSSSTRSGKQQALPPPIPDLDGTPKMSNKTQDCLARRRILLQQAKEKKKREVRDDQPADLEEDDDDDDRCFLPPSLRESLPSLRPTSRLRSVTPRTPQGRTKSSFAVPRTPIKKTDSLLPRMVERRSSTRSTIPPPPPPPPAPLRKEEPPAPKYSWAEPKPIPLSAKPFRKESDRRPVSTSTTSTATNSSMSLMSNISSNSSSTGASVQASRNRGSFKRNSRRPPSGEWKKKDVATNFHRRSKVFLRQLSRRMSSHRGPITPSNNPKLSSAARKASLVPSS